ncbi:uncharacterized protein LOC126992216 [Eriocheir sinensis]|uniref:uncharacterized protein LOC126992216 n=1 Tax=Eriocheir sinensis TaxID=95602 RepID=UPI0021C60A78|nr:uncharacterized protein LOC126992216 [Eriocheir sinensis]
MARVSICLALLALLSTFSSATNNCTAGESRRKRMIYMDSNRRLTLPPNTLLILTPTLSLPFGRNLPLGYGSSMTISVPFKIDFEQLGLTSEENPFGIFPDFFFRRKRDADLPGINWAGGDREMMFQIIEDSLHNLGMEGQGCLLRAICEMFQAPLVNHGFVGEFLELFLSVSRSPYADKRLGEYLAAERIGRSSGDCSEYHQMCPHSLFTTSYNTKVSEDEAGSGGTRQEGSTAGAASEQQAGRKEGGGVRQYPSVTRTKKKKKRCYQQHT